MVILTNVLFCFFYLDDQSCHDDKNSINYKILCLYSNNVLVLFESEQGNIVWKKNLSNSKCDFTAKSFQMDPFDKANLLLTLSNSSSSNNDCCFALIKDIDQAKPSIRRFHLYLKNEDTSNKSNSTSPNSKFEYFIEEVGKSLSKSEDSFVFISNYIVEYIKLIYHQSYKNKIILALSREILIIDFELIQIVCVVSMERNASNIVNIYSCWQRNMLITLHESGTLAARLAQKSLRQEPQNGVEIIDLTYPLLCFSDGLRLTKHNKIYGFAVLPTSELNYALLSNNGKIFIYKLHRKSSKSNSWYQFLSDIITQEDYQYKKIGRFCLMIKKMMSSASNPPHVIRMCPPVTARNWHAHKPYLAIGDYSGNIQIYNTGTKLIEKEFSIHTSAVRGIEWASLAVILSYAYSSVSRNSGRVTNELCITAVNTGRSQSLRTERNNETAPIEMLKVSHLKQYFILTFKCDLIEIWDLKRLTILRVISKFSSLITAVEWSSLYNKSKKNADGKSMPIKENFVITNSESELYHFSVLGNNVKEISSTPDLNNNSITSIAWKSDQLVLGDAEGNISIWYLKAKIYKSISTDRGTIRKIRFGPGRGNLRCLILYNDGVDIFDLKDLQVTSSLKYPRDISFKIQDIDWATVDKPILSSQEGSIFIMDITMKHYNSTVIDEQLTDLSTFRLDTANFLLLSSMSRFIIQTKVAHNTIDEIDSSTPLPVNCIDRYLLLAKLLGDKEAIYFWELVLHHLFDENETEYRPLDSNYDLFLNKKEFKKMCQERVAIFESKRVNLDQNHKCCEYHLWLGNHKRAIQLLLETEPLAENNSYQIESLKACLISLLGSLNFDNHSSHPVVKLVATNMIASGNMFEGIQLLFLIGKCQDACRYLQSHSLWAESILLAKLNLNQEENSSIINSWLHHLDNQKSEKLFALLSTHSYQKVIEHLFKNDDVQISALFADLCLDKHLVSLKNSKDLSLLSQVYLAYAEKLEEAGFNQIGQSYRNKLATVHNDDSETMNLSLREQER